MSMFKKNGGFTLVELIVVIAILAILAGIAIPMYSGYINKAKEAGDIQIVSAVNTAVQAATATGKAELASATYENGEIKVTFAATATGTAEDVADAEADYELFMGDNSTKFDYYDTVTKNAKGLVEGSKAGTSDSTDPT